MIDYSQCPDQALRFTGTALRDKVNGMMNSIGKLSKKEDASNGAIYSAIKSKKKAACVTSSHYWAGGGDTCYDLRVGDNYYRVIFSVHNAAVKTVALPKPAAKHRNRRDAMYLLHPSDAAAVIQANNAVPASTGGSNDGEEPYINQDEPYMNNTFAPPESPYGSRIPAP